MNTAIMVDGGFYRKVSRYKKGEATPEERANELEQYCYDHLEQESGNFSNLYRIFYYDCLPMDKKVYHPYYSKTVDLAKSELNQWMKEFTNTLMCKRKFALRLGKLASKQAEYAIRSESFKKIYQGKKNLLDLNENDFMLSVSQKGVDMKIGLDIASLAYKKLVDQIVLISADSDFVPAAKLARREGIDFILDPLGCPIKKDLFEHIDGLRSRDACYSSSN